MLRLVVALALGAIAATAALWYFAATDDPDTAVLLARDGVSPFNTICNAVVVDDGLGVTVEHCLEPAEFIAVGGESICDAEGWTTYRIAARQQLGDDLYSFTWEGTKRTDLTPEAPEPSGREERELELRGFGRRDGRGGLECAQQVLPVAETSLGRCLAADPQRSHVLCLDASTRLCPSWSGSAVYDDGTPIAVISAGTNCVDPGGIVIATTIGPPAPAPTS